MNNRANAIDKIKEFLLSDKKYLFLYGTYIYEKIKLALDVVLSNYPQDKIILFRSNSMAQAEMDLEILKPEHRIKTGKPLLRNEKKIFIDSSNCRSWGKTPNKVDLSIIYPVGSLKKYDDNYFRKCLIDIDNRTEEKIIFISYLDIVPLTEIFDLIPIEVEFDLEEEDPDYHQRMLEFYKNIRLGRRP